MPEQSENKATSPDSVFDKIVVNAWSDPAFKSKLFTDPAAALAILGARTPAGVAIKVVENTETLDHLVIPVRPRGGLTDEKIAEATGIQLDSTTGGSSQFMPFCKWCSFCLELVKKAWSDPTFKAKLLAEPRAAVMATGADVRQDEAITVLQNTDQLVYLVLPKRPTGELSEEALEMVAAGTAACWIARIN